MHLALHLSILSMYMDIYVPMFAVSMTPSVMAHKAETSTQENVLILKCKFNRRLPQIASASINSQCRQTSFLWHGIQEQMTWWHIFEVWGCAIMLSEEHYSLQSETFLPNCWKTQSTHTQVFHSGLTRLHLSPEHMFGTDWKPRAV